MKLNSPAKLNLILKIVGKTPNNYHLLEMFNVLIDLEDIIEINESETTTIKYDKYEIKQEEDTIYKAVTAFINKYYLPNQSIYIIKNIPVGAGLGGVSSNIASIINFFNEHYKLNLSKKELLDFVLAYGTDICYLLYNDKAIVKGIGEIVEPFDYKLNKKVLIINPNIKIETKYIYNKVREISESILNKEYILNSNILDILENDLEKVVFDNFENVKKLYIELTKHLDNVHMSGSGSTLYSLISEVDLNIVEKIKQMYPNYLMGLYNIK